MSSKRRIRRQKCGNKIRHETLETAIKHKMIFINVLSARGIILVNQIENDNNQLFNSEENNHDQRTKI